ncbi:MAG: hypothetical protein ACLQOO_15595 [Terriglobia bacterium]
MTITVDITPEAEAALARQAAARGRAVESYAASLLEEAARLPCGAAQAANLVDLCEPIRGLLGDDEIDRLFSRNPSTGRPLDLS